ncbi:glycoside hydrolase [Penicillium herquei]|nr:glycoside hydrolase [Penicillium herquei]
MTAALVAGLAFMAPGAAADSSDAQSAMSAFLKANPISTRSASAPEATNITAAVLAGKFTPSRSWNFLHDPCPGSCETLGVNSSDWPVYPSWEKLSRCDETILLQFSLDTPVDSGGKVSLRSCTGDLAAETAVETETTSCASLSNTTSVTSSIQIYRDTDSTEGSSIDAIDALTQLLAYDALHLSGSCNETMSFAYSGSTAVGIYMGSGLHSQSLLPSVIDELIDTIKSDGTAGTLMV